jgi:hypothetical protein
MGYYIELSEITLDELQNDLKSSDLLPSQQILKVDIDKIFEKIKNQKNNNLAELQTALKTKKSMETFSSQSSLSIEYLTILRRLINSYHPEPRDIKDFSCLNEKIKTGLRELGIFTTVNLYDWIKNENERKKLKSNLDIADEEILLLTKLTDLSRLRYVNQTFAELLINSDYDTVDKIKKADYEKLYDNLIKINSEKGYFKGKIGLKDMKFFVNDKIYSTSAIEY